MNIPLLDHIMGIKNIHMLGTINVESSKDIYQYIFDKA